MQILIQRLWIDGFLVKMQLPSDSAIRICLYNFLCNEIFAQVIMENWMMRVDWYYFVLLDFERFCMMFQPFDMTEDYVVVLVNFH